MFNRIPVAERAALYSRFSPDSGRVGRQLSLSMIPVDERKVRCPVLVIACADDRYVVPRIGRRLARKYEAPYREYSRHAHFPQYEPGWEVVASDVLGWLETAVSQADASAREVVSPVVGDRAVAPHGDAISPQSNPAESRPEVAP